MMQTIVNNKYLLAVFHMGVECLYRLMVDLIIFIKKIVSSNVLSKIAARKGLFEKLSQACPKYVLSMYSVYFSEKAL